MSSAQVLIEPSREVRFGRPARGKGIGKALIADLARRCVVEELGRLEWAVLDWNEPSIRFYRSLGAERLEDWQTFRLTGPELRRLGADQA